MLTGHRSLISPSCKRRCVSSHIHTNRQLNVACSAEGSNNKQTGWHWPFSKNTAGDDIETEIVYVTDTAEADEVIEEPEYVDDDRQVQLDDQIGAGAAAVAAEDGNVLQQEQLPGQYATPLHSEADATQGVPEATASALTQSEALHNQPQHQQQRDVLVAQPASISGSLRPAFASSSLSVPLGTGYWATSAGGWVVALSLLIAVRQGRSHADAARLDVRALQARQHDSRVQSRALKEKRAQYLQQQQLLKEEAAAKRLAEQAREAEKTRREAAVKAAEYERTAKEELDLFRAQRAAAKKAFEEKQGKLEEELAARTAREIALREKAEAKKAAEEAAKRAAAAAEAARAAAEAAAVAEAAERAAREAVAARAAMKQQLRASSLQYQLHLQGSAVAAPVSAGGRQPQLSVTLTLLPDTPSGSSSGSNSGSVSAPPSVAAVNRVFDSPDAATEGATALAVQAAQLVYEHYIPAIAEGVIDLEGLSVFGQAAQRTQQQQQQDQTAGREADAAVARASAESSNAAARGVQLSAADNMLWRLLLLSKIEAAGRQAVGQVAPLAASGELQQELKAQLIYSILPSSDLNSLQQRLQQCADLVQQQQLPAAIQMLDDIIEWQLEDFIGAGSLDTSSNTSSSLAQVLQELVTSGAAAASPASPYLVPACVYAVLLNLFDPATRIANRASSSAESPPGSTEVSRASSPDSTATGDEDMFDSTSIDGSSSATLAAAAGGRRSIVSDSDSPLQRLAKFQLEQLEKAAPADQLTPVAACLQQLLGRRHPVAAAMQLLAERNMSPGARQARALRQQQKQLAMATELLKGSPVAGPGGLDPQGARMRQQLVPTPERIWALRNVANSMLRSTASSGGGGTSSSSTPSAEEAVSMLKQASDLAAEHYGKDHPGCLSALLDYIGSLLAVPGHQQEAKAAIEAACGIVAAVGDRYRQQKDLLSLVLLYESTQAELDVPEVIGRECVAMTRLLRQAADAFSVLETAQANMVMSKRKLPPGSPSTALRQLARDCTEQLGVYAAGKKRETRLEQWNKGLPLTPLR